MAALSTAVPPLRVQKGTNGSSPTKNMAFIQNRPLSELSPMALRRNSPSFPRKNSLSKAETSPIKSSPSNNANSPRVFWQGRDPNSPVCENTSPHGSVPPAKRSSIENLKKASRVKNSSMFAREQQNNYDPSNPFIPDGKPLRNSLQGNAFAGKGLFGSSTTSFDSLSSPTRELKPAEDIVVKDFGSPPPPEKFDSSPFNQVAPLSPSKLSQSPTKSSLSKNTGAQFKRSGFDPATGIWEDEDDDEKKLPEGKSLRRHAKSVTFDQAPPQVNEYEMTTPVPSSVASGSREGSYESFDEDEDEYSFERGSSFDPHDDSFDASLEDTEKTPVVLPEDWRFMSPETANTVLVKEEEDVFADGELGSPGPEASPGSMIARPHQSSAQSVDSNGQVRPLPPLPPQMNTAQKRHSLSSTLERLSGSHRALPSPPPAAAISKDDIRRMSLNSLSLEDRLKLMMVKDTTPQIEADAQRERRMRRAASKESSPIREQFKNQGAVEDVQEEEPVHSKEEKLHDRRISRDFILQQLRADQDDISRSNSQYSVASHAILDPDIPIPSREDPTQTFDDDDDEYEDDSVVIKEEPLDDSELYSIPEMYRKTSSQLDAEDEVRSQCSETSIQKSVELNAATPRAHTPVNDAVKPVGSARMSIPDFMDFGPEKSLDFGLGQYNTRKSEELHRHAVAVKVQEIIPEPELPDLAALRSEIVRPFTPEEQLEPPRPSFADDEETDEPGTPSSVIRHPINRSLSPVSDDGALSLGKTDSNNESFKEPEVDSYKHRQPESSAEPTPSITVEPFGNNNSGEVHQTTYLPEASQLSNHLEPEKKRVGPRVSSLVQLDFPRDEPNDSLGLGLEREFDRVLETQKVAFELSLQRLYRPFHGRFPFVELPELKEFDNRPGSPYAAPPKPSIRERFANRSLKRQRGYLMRHNTKIVVATERASVDESRSPAQETSSNSLVVPDANPNEVVVSPRKTSQPAWVAEPWNNKSRRRSIRVNGEDSPKRKAAAGPVPPLPGQPSAVDNLGVVAEDELAEEEAEEFEEGVERGRLFVKVVGVKDLQLPFPQRKRPRELGQIHTDQPEDERTQFALTLDNGLHCVTTSWLDLACNAPIGQEFELVVLNELEFQLTLQMKLEEPAKLQMRPESPSKAPSSPKKQNAFGRLFGSPKKKKESEVRAQQEAQATKRPVTPPSAYELVQGIVAKDGSFARAYVTLTEFEQQVFGRPATVDIKCFNEWAMEEVPVGSSRSKKGVVQLQRRPPYEIGKLELQLLYVPKPKGAKDEDMPKSMNGAIRAMREAEERVKQQAEVKTFEGYLSQQGGDCPYWRRRFFKLVGTKLTAYHETTHQPRATINLAKAARLIDDRANLAKKDTSTKGGGRRKSAFADDEEGYMFVEEGFRIKFGNGETIDFYADSAIAKDEWIAALIQVVGKQIAPPTGPTKGWTEMVLKREKSTRVKSLSKSRKVSDKEKELPARPPIEQRQSYQSAFMASGALIPTADRTSSAIPRPSQGHSRTESYQALDASRSQAGSPVKSKVGSAERHRKTKSMWG